jgi:hypothetical protein
MQNTDITTDLEILKITRQNALNLIKDFTYDQLIKIPVGFNNSLLWNFTHMVITQQILVYKFSGGTPLVDDELISLFKKGSEGSNNISPQAFNAICAIAIPLVGQTANDYKELSSNAYSTYTTSYNITLDSTSKAINFNNSHEALHLGVMMQIKKFI